MINLGRIFFILGGLPFGGIANLLFEISKELQVRDIDFTVVNLSGVGDKLCAFEDHDLPVINLASSVDVLKTYRLDTIVKLRNIICDLRPSIIHTMEFSGDYFGRLAALGMNIPIVTHIHTTKKQKKMHRKIANKLLSRKTDVYLSVSEAVNEVIKKEHSSNKRSIVLYNALSSEKITHKSKYYYKNETKSSVVACVGRLVEQKNFDMALKAYKILCEKINNVDLWIIGEGKERNKLESLAHDLCIENKVTFWGYRSDVEDLLARSDILLMPSQYEGLGISVLEAMQLGIPAVISKYVSAKEIAWDCCLVCETHPDDIAAKLCTLLTDDSLYAELARNAKARSQSFTIDTYVDKLLDVYQSLLPDYNEPTHG
ncbi:glycosyltransferase family 4 protein [Desulfovermiculus halophilus]|uniref:glycosyltransferase family 4 protein n=1 Tax=Desulfovermiculus halophilus TaxID=339722 RepID=UPI0006880EEA|nr:glycosyltransferase family 4 protein [Desulfovermiculus halophilus]